MVGMSHFLSRSITSRTEKMDILCTRMRLSALYSEFVQEVNYQRSVG